MKHTTPRGTPILAAFLALATLSPSLARADYAYAYAIQGFQNFRIVTGGGAQITPGTVTVSGTNSASLTTFAPVINNDGADTAQAYVGTPAPPPENFGFRNFSIGNPPGVNPPPLSAAGTTGTNGDAFANFATASLQANGNPIAPPDGLAANSEPISLKTFPTGSQGAASFARGDMLVQGTLADIFTTGGLNMFNVAEAYVRTLGDASGSGTFVITARFTAATSGVIDLNGTYSNSTYAATTDPAAPGSFATATYKTDYTLTNLTTGGTDQHASPVHLNHTQTALANQREHLDWGTDVTTGATTFNIVAGNQYQLQMSFQEAVSVSVPEPSSLVIMGLGVGALGLAFRRRLLPSRPE